MRESAGRNKGREEGDVRTIWWGWMLRTISLSWLYWPGTIAFCREQSFYVVFSVHCCIGCEPVVYFVDCWLVVSKEQSVWTMVLIKGGTELLEVLGTKGQDIRRYPGAR